MLPKKRLLVLLVVVLLALLMACTSGPKSALTNQQAVAIIAIQAVPSIDAYLKQAGQSPINYPVGAVGDWDAVYGEDHIWTVKGQVVARYPSGDKNCSTVWTLNEVDGTIKLVKFVCQ